MNEIKFIDLFGGIGGFRLGLESANDSIKTRIQQRIRQKGVHSSTTKQPLMGTKQFTCVWYCDKDKYATQTYNKNFKENHDPTDITTVETKDIPDFNMLCAGFPCQSFSIAGKRKGFKDTRGTMFYEILKIASEKKPRLVFLENVKGLLNHDEGRTYKIILESLSQLGYDVEWQVFNSKNFGVPQNRERVFIIGHLRGTSPRQVFPLRKCFETYQENNKQEGWNRMETSLALRGGARQRYDGETLIQLGVIGNNNSMGQRVYDSDGIGSSIRSGGGGQSGKTGLYMIRKVALTEKRTEEAKKIRKKMMENGKDWSPRRGKELVCRTDDQGNTVTSGQSKEQLLIDGAKIRRLTPVECERLQGFPDGWTDGVSDTQRYKQLGNAVTVNVIEAIGEVLN